MYRTIYSAACALVCLISSVPALSEPMARNPFDRPSKLPYLTADDVRAISAAVGFPVQVGYAIVGGNPKRPIQIPSRDAIPSQSIASDERSLNEPTSSAPSVTSPSYVDLSELPPNYVPPPYQPDPGAYSAKLEARSLRIFPWGSQEEDRQRWMAEQEQREIANEINASKPLIFPVGTR